MALDPTRFSTVTRSAPSPVRANNCSCGSCETCTLFYRLGLLLERLQKPVGVRGISRTLPLSELAVGQEFEWAGREGTLIRVNGDAAMAIMDGGKELRLYSSTPVRAFSTFSPVYVDEVPR